jgi:hypothetical protein
MLDGSFSIYLLKLEHEKCNWDSKIVLVENSLLEFDYFIWMCPLRML